MNILKNIALFIIVCIFVLIVYAFVIYILIKLSNLFSGSVIGSIFAKASLWGGQFGLGIVIYPVLVILTFKYIKGGRLG